MRKLRDAVAQAVEDMLLDRPIETDPVGAFRAGVLDLSSGPIVCLDIEEQLRLFRPGDLVDPIEPEPYSSLPLEPYPNNEARLLEPDGLEAKERERLRRARVQRWFVVNVRWDEPTSYLWIELVSLGGHFRGWLRDPVRRVKHALPSG